MFSIYICFLKTKTKTSFLGRRYRWVKWAKEDIQQLSLAVFPSALPTWWIPGRPCKIPLPGERRWCLGSLNCRRMKSHSDDTWWRCGLCHIFSTFSKPSCGRPTIPPLIVPHISSGLLSAPLHMTSFCSKGRDAWRQTADAFSVGDFMIAPTLRVCFCSFAAAAEVQAQQALMGLMLGGKIFSCLGGRWRNVDARRLMNPQVKQQWKQLWPDFESGGKKAE